MAPLPLYGKLNTNGTLNPLFLMKRQLEVQYNIGREFSIPWKGDQYSLSVLHVSQFKARGDLIFNRNSLSE